MKLQDVIAEFMNGIKNDAGRMVIKELDFHIIQGCPTLELWKKLDGDSKNFEHVIKGYFLGVIKDDKELRIKSLKKIKELSETLPEALKSFRKHYQNHRDCSTKGCKPKNKD